MWNVAVLDVGVAVEVGDRAPVGGRISTSLVLAELDRFAGVLDERGHVAAEEHLAVAHADHQRRIAPGGDDGVGLVGVEHHQGEGPAAGGTPPRPQRRVAGGLAGR